MIANNSPKSFKVKIKRQDEASSTPYWQTFDVEYRPNMNVISTLQKIAAKPVTAEGKEVAPVIWDCGCLEEVCGACTMVINGRVRQACSTLVDEELESNSFIKLEPMSKFPVVRDLWVDRSRMFDNLKRIKGWVPTDGTYDLGAGPKETQEEQDLRYAYSRCMSCGCCLEACPQFTKDNDFMGAQIFAQTDYFNSHETGKLLIDERMDVILGEGGISDCGNSQNCVQVCPKELPLLNAIAKVGRTATIHSIKKFFTGNK